MSDQIVSIIRTIVPSLVGAIVAFFVSKGINVDEATQAQAISLLTVVFISLYYSAARYLETKYPKLGYLLGVPKTPTYTDNEK